MAVVTGTLSDFQLDALAPYSPQVVFTPSGVATSLSRLLATRPVTVVPDATGFFSVDLVPSTTLVPDAWYDVTIRWLEADGGYAATDHVGWRLDVPPAGGTISDLFRVNAGRADVWIGPTEPVDAQPTGSLWINTSVRPPALYKMEP